MVKCAKCGKSIEGRVSYCPGCGTLLLPANEKSLIPANVLKTLKERSLANAPKGMVKYNKKEYEDAVKFYKSHLSTGYAPKGMVIVSKGTHEVLKVSETRLENNRNKYGTQTGPDGMTIPKYRTKSRTVDRVVDRDSDDVHDFVKVLYEEQSIFIRVIILIIFWLLVVSGVWFGARLYYVIDSYSTWLGILYIVISLPLFGIPGAFIFTALYDD